LEGVLPGLNPDKYAYHDVSLSSLTHLLMDVKPARYMTINDLKASCGRNSAIRPQGVGE